MNNIKKMLLSLVLLVSILTPSVSAETLTKLPEGTEYLYEEGFVEQEMNDRELEMYEAIVENLDGIVEVYFVANTKNSVKMFVFIPSEVYMNYIVMATEGDRDSIELWEESTKFYNELSFNLNDYSKWFDNIENDYASILLNSHEYERFLFLSVNGEISYDVVNEIHNIDKTVFNKR